MSSPADSKWNKAYWKHEKRMARYHMGIEKMLEKMRQDHISMEDDSAFEGTGYAPHDLYDAYMAARKGLEKAAEALEDARHAYEYRTGGEVPSKV